MTNTSTLPKKYASEQVLVVTYDAVSSLLPSKGVFPVNDSLLGLISVPQTMRRDLAEESTAMTQLVAYYVIINDGRLLTHRRTRRQPEKRLTDVRAIGISGHMISSDLKTLTTGDLFHEGDHAGYANRELAEEISVRVSSKAPIRLAGFIWEPVDDFGKQHLGLLYIVPAERDFRVLEPGLIGNADFVDPDQIMANIGEYTSWSKLLLDSEILKTCLSEGS